MCASFRTCKQERWTWHKFAKAWACRQVRSVQNVISTDCQRASASVPLAGLQQVGWLLVLLEALQVEIAVLALLQPWVWTLVWDYLVGEVAGFVQGWEHLLNGSWECCLQQEDDIGCRLFILPCYQKTSCRCSGASIFELIAGQSWYVMLNAKYFAQLARGS